MKTTLQKITAKAKQIRKAKPSLAWTDAIKAASKAISGVKKKAAPKKAAKKKKLDPNRQNGTSVTFYDKAVKAKAPGKRKSASGNIYYERRKNRSDKPGSLTGVLNTQFEFNKVPGRIARELEEKSKAEKQIEALKAHYRAAKTATEKSRLKKAQVLHMKLLQTAKNNITNLKKLL